MVRHVIRSRILLFLHIRIRELQKVHFILESQGGRHIELITLTGRSRVETLMRYTYRKKMAYGMGKGRELFDLCSRVAGAVPIKRIMRTGLSFRLDELIALIKDDLE
jgi:hypothetical protein